jgi:hypothetical protein
MTADFVNVNGQLNSGPGDADAKAARALITEIGCSFFDGLYLKVERELLCARWQLDTDENQRRIMEIKPERLIRVRGMQVVFLA